MDPDLDPQLLEAITETIAQLAWQADRILTADPTASIAGVVHQRGTLEWKQLRTALEQASGREQMGDLIAATLDRATVFDLLARGAGVAEVRTLEAALRQPGRWFPVVVITADGRCRTAAVPLFGPDGPPA